MLERLDGSLRRRVMWRPAAALALTLPLALAGCGDRPVTNASAEGSSAVTPAACAKEPVSTGARLGEVDLDGDRVPDPVSYASATAECPAHLVATIAGHALSAPVTGELAVSPTGAAAVAIPGRTGEALLVKAQHPRGGFQAHLFGYADGRFAELTAEGRPLFDFVATDAMSTPTAARCDDGGFAVLQARAHEPIGVAPAWDVFRTAYSVDGNSVTKGATTEIADNVLDHELHRQYADLVGYDFFSDCLAQR
jgi:hypothetical protein